MANIVLVEGNNEHNVQLSPLTSNLHGKVTSAETGKPLYHATVRLHTGRWTWTNLQGEYLLKDMPLGSYTVTFEKDVYYSIQRRIILSELDYELNVQLKRPLELIGFIVNVVIWHEPLSSWKSIYRTTPHGEEVTTDERLIEVPANSEIHIGTYWVNLSEVEITAHMDIIVDGQYPSAVRGQDVTARQYAGGSMQFEPFSLQPGSHSLRVKFSSGGTLLDSWNTTLRATE